MTIGILITAAGSSVRFKQAGGMGNKLNTLLGNRCLFEKTLYNAIESQLPIHVITRFDNIKIIDICNCINISYSLLNSNGLGETIACGVKNTLNWRGWLIHLADMPFVNHTLFTQVAKALEQYPLVRPVYQHQLGHPVGISEQYRHQLLQLTGDDGAKSILSSNPVYQIEIDDQRAVWDIDLPNQLVGQ